MEEKIQDWKSRMTEIKLEMQAYLRQNSVGKTEKINVTSATYGLMAAVRSVGRIIGEDQPND